MHSSIIDLFSQQFRQLHLITSCCPWLVRIQNESCGEEGGFKKSALCYAICLQAVHIPSLILEHYKLLEHSYKAYLYVHQITSGNGINSSVAGPNLCWCKFDFLKVIFFYCNLSFLHAKVNWPCNLYSKMEDGDESYPSCKKKTIMWMVCQFFHSLQFLGKELEARTIIYLVASCL